MTKYEQLNEMLDNNDGYLFSADVSAAGISRTYLGRFVNEKGLERVAQGVYLSPDAWNDELFILQKTNPGIIYSDDTALYLHGLLDREYATVCVTVPTGFNGSRLVQRGIRLHRVKTDTFPLGITSIETGLGHSVRAYDMERCICDLIKARNKTEIQTFQTAIKEYMRRKDKRLSVLARYAKSMNMLDEVMKYIEVMV